MKTTVRYEWDRETLAYFSAKESPLGEDGLDVVGHNHADKLKDVPSHEDLLTEGIDNTDLALIRDVWGSDGNLLCRQWAYVVGRFLPEHFDGGNIVPKRFHEALEYSKPTQPLTKQM